MILSFENIMRVLFQEGNIMQIASTGTYQYSPETYKTSCTVNSSVSDKPLTDKELAFAKAFELHTAYDNARKRLDDARSGTCEDEKIAAFEAALAIRKEGMENRHLFTSDYYYAFGIVEVFSAEETYAQLTALMEKASNPKLDLPHQGYSFNAASNSIKLGIGSKIPMDGFVLEIDWLMAFRTLNGQRLTSISSDVNALQGLIYAAISGNCRWGDATPPPDRVGNDNSGTIAFLRKLGVDTSRDFSINGTVFEIKDGFLQTKGYVAPEQKPILGFEGFSELLYRAKAQNLL